MIISGSNLLKNYGLNIEFRILRYKLSIPHDSADQLLLHCSWLTLIEFIAVTQIKPLNRIKLFIDFMFKNVSTGGSFNAQSNRFLVYFKKRCWNKFAFDFLIRSKQMSRKTKFVRFLLPAWRESGTHDPWCKIADATLKLNGKFGSYGVSNCVKERRGERCVTANTCHMRMRKLLIYFVRE